MSIVAYLAAGAVLLLSVASLAWVHWIACVPLIGIGVVVASWLYELGRRLEASTGGARPEERFTQLAARLSPQSELAVHVYGATQISWGVLGLMIAASVLFWGIVREHILAIVGATVLLAGAAFFLLQVLLTLGQPRLVLTAAGFRLPGAPLVPWQVVEGISLQPISHQRHPLTMDRRPVAHILWFYVPAQKKRAQVMLAGSSEDPEVVYRLARHLWRQSTGRDYPWFPSMTEEAAAEYKKQDETFARLKEHLQRGPDADPQEFSRLMAGLHAGLDRTERAMREDLRRTKNQLRLIAVAALVAVVVMVLFNLYKVMR